MSNPRIINSTYIKQFGFRVTVDVEARTLLFDIAGLTQFHDGGMAAVQGINFEVTDPSGVVIADIDFPSKDIDPVQGQTAVVLPLTTGIALFGWYTFRGVIKDADGRLYEVALDPVQVLRPKGYSEDCQAGCVKGTFDVDTDCQRPRIRLSETTNLTYQGRTARTVVTDGKLYYPRGTASELAFTKTPLSTATVYTGDYVLRAKTKATYDMGQHVYVSVSYCTHQPFTVACNNRVCDVLCCLDDLYADYRRHIGDARGQRARDLIAEVSVPLLAAVAKERCGKDATHEVAQIKAILNCDDCGCSGPGQRVQPAGLGAGAALYEFEGEAATSVEVDDNGHVTIKTKHVVVAKQEPGDTAFAIEKEEDDTNIVYKLGFDYTVLASTLLTTIKNDSELTSYLNSLITAVGVNPQVVGLDGRCVLDVTASDYTLMTQVTAGWKMLSLLVNGERIEAAAPQPATPEALEEWLNGLDRGVYDVTQQGNLLLVRSQASVHVPVALYISHRDAVQPTKYHGPQRLDFVRTARSLSDVLQAIIDYLCDLTAARVRTGEVLRLCTLNAAGGVSATQYGPDVTLQTFLRDLSQAFCKLVARLAEAPKVDCVSLKRVFLRNDTPLAADDVLYGQKGETCAAIGLKDVALAVVNLIRSDGDVRNLFCTVDCGAPDACPAIVSLSVTATQTTLTLNRIKWATAPAENQIITVRYRLASGGALTEVSTNAVVLPDGRLQVPLLIDGLTPNTQYYIEVANNCNLEASKAGELALTTAALCPAVTSITMTSVIE